MKTKTRIFCYLLVKNKIAAVKLLMNHFKLNLVEAKYLSFYIEDRWALRNKKQKSYRYLVNIPLSLGDTIAKKINY